MNKTKVFISYSWDSDNHREWVRKLADALEEINELHVVWDGYDLDALKDKNIFMEAGIYDSDYIIVIATKKYKEKADNRSGGVGIETYLASAVHWDGLQKQDKTKVIVALRETDSVPNYLKGHLYIDFTADLLYSESESKLLKYFRRQPTIPRPQKLRSLSSDEHIYSFTKVEDLIRVGHTNRRPIVNNEQGTNFSGSNRIKYELWETKSPAIAYYLALASNINITQTVNHAIEQLKALGVQPADLTVLRPRAGRAEQALIPRLFTQAGFSTHIHELTYKDYIWNFCIDESLKRSDPPSEIANYTDQSLSYENDQGELTIADSARDLLVDLLQQPSSTSAHLVVAPGGMGKTSLCLAVATKLHNRQDLHSSVIVIQAESIKRYIAGTGAPGSRIDSVFQLYELYVRHHHFDHEFDRNTFELAFLSGNLVIVIDGLDEFVSLFPDAFSLDIFLASLDEFHRELGSSAVLLTTRNSQLVEHIKLGDLSVVRYDLLGFDRRTCESYLRRRFNKYSNGGAIAAKVQSQIDKVQLREQDERVVPFFADIAATVVEDGLKDDTSEELEISEDPTPYPSNNDLTDHIIHSVMRREEVRHGLDLSVNDVVQLLSSLVVDFSKRWPKTEMLERLTIYYDNRGPVLNAKIGLNPLLIQTDDYIELRYSFLASYFEVVHLLHGITRHSLEREFIKSLARLSTEANEFRELKRYFSSRRDELIKAAASLISLLRKEADFKNSTHRIECEQARRAIASLLNLAAQVIGGSAQHITETVLRLYGITPNTNSPLTVSGLHVRGDFPIMDLSNLTVTNSSFTGYKKLLSCKYQNTQFMYCSFDLCFDPSIQTSSLDPKSLDQTCELGDLREFVALARAGKRDENRLVELETRKFLHSFFKGDRFADNSKGHIRFSTKVPGLAEKRFDRILNAGYVSLKREKEVDNFYEISESFRPSVRKLLTDNYTDAAMRKFFAFLRG
jgi:hypothetical protein